MKTVLITGASRGIGLSLAKKFFENGYFVFAHYHQTLQYLKLWQEQLSARKAKNLVLCQADLMQQDGADQLFSMIDCPIDVLINNAGISEYKLFDQITQKEWDDMLNLNLKSYFLCAQKVFPNMLHNKSGSIINISSIWGETGAAMEVHYATAKAGILGLTKALARELAPSGICVNAIAPGVVNTDMLSGLSAQELTDLKETIPLGRFALPEEIADLAFFLAEQKYITGEVININGGLLI